MKRLSPAFSQKATRGSRPVLDARQLLITPMEQGIRMTTGVEFAARDAAPSAQFDRILPRARERYFR